MFALDIRTSLGMIIGAVPTHSRGFRREAAGTNPCDRERSSACPFGFAEASQMRISAKVALMLGTAVLFAGCAESQTPANMVDGISQARPIASHAQRDASWMLPEAKREKLLYVSSYYKYVNVYSYPKGKLVGTLTGFGILSQDCSDRRGNVWIIDNQNGKLYEYAHGGTVPIALIIPPSGNPLSCVVNPRNGDLAVGTGTEALFVYRHAKGTPVEYQDYAIEGFFYCAYDPKGNLFISGVTPDYKFQFAELPRGAASILNITLDQSITRPGGVAATSNSVAVGDGASGTIYEFQIAGSGGTEVGATVLDGAYGALGEFLIHGRRVVAALSSESFSAVDIFDWPAGGAPINEITGDLQAPLGVAVSVPR